MLENFDMDTSITSPGTSYPNGGLYFQEGSTGFYNLGDMWFITYVTTGPDAPTASAQIVCSGATVADLVATGTDLKWYTAETGGTALANTAELSSATYYVSQTVDGTESDRTSVSVTVSTAITVTATATNVSCNGYNDGSITTTVSGGTAPYIYFWSNGETTASISNLSSGTYNLLSIIDDNGCELGDGFGNPSALSVTISEPAFLNAPTAEAQAFCGTSTVSDLLPTSSSTIIWYNVETEGSALEATTELATGTYYVSETNSNGCESERTAVNVSINGVPHAPTANSVQIYTSEATIADLTATGTGLLWYDAATNGTSLDLTVSLVDGTTYYVSQTTTCGESLKTAITVKEISEASQAFCGAATVENLTSTPSADATVKWYSDATGGTALVNTTVLTTGTYYIEESKTGSAITLLSDLYNPSGVAVQSDGKILVSDYNDGHIIHMNADGTNNETLGNGFVDTRDVVIEADGKILVVGIGDIKRMDADGSNIVTLLDGNTEIKAVSIQADGEIIFFNADGGSLMRMNADGTAIEILNDQDELDIDQTAIQTDGKIVVANFGYRSIIRMDADGTNLETLGGVFNYPTGVAIQADGKIVVAIPNGEIKRMNPDGTGLETIANVSNPGKLAIEADGKILVLANNTIKRITEAYTSNRVSINVTINEAPEAPTVSTPVTYNQGDIASELAATTGGTGFMWYTTETGGTGDVNAPTPDTSTGGFTSYWVSSTNDNGCESERTEIVVNVNAPATHLNFGAVNDYVDCGNGSSLQITGNTITLEAYVNFNSFGSSPAFGNIINKDDITENGYMLRAGGNGVINFVIASAGWNELFSPDNTINLNQWHHISGVYDGVNFKIYVDGIEVASQPLSVNIGNVAANLNLGKDSYFQKRFIDASLDEVRIWNVARTAEQINSSKNCELQGDETGLVAYYQFNQGLGAGNNTSEVTILDATTNNNNGTLTNFTLSGTTSNWLSGSPIAPKALITEQPQNLVYSESNPIVFTVTASNVTTYQWEYSEDGGLSWEPLSDSLTDPDVSGSQTHELTLSGNDLIFTTELKFRVVLNAESECSAISTEVEVSETLGVDVTANNAIQVYPNPAKDNISITLPSAQESKITVYDSNGRLLLNKTETTTKSIIDLSNYEAGVYLLKIEVNQSEIIKRIVKH